MSASDSLTVLMETEAVFSSLRECGLSTDSLAEFSGVTSALGLIPTGRALTSLKTTIITAQRTYLSGKVNTGINDKQSLRYISGALRSRTALKDPFSGEESAAAALFPQDSENNTLVTAASSLFLSPLQ